MTLEETRRHLEQVFEEYEPDKRRCEVSESQLLQEARERVKTIRFGDPITNICSSGINRYRLCFFVRAKKDTVVCTDKENTFWETATSAIYQGHLSIDKCKELFVPMHRILFPESYKDDKEVGNES